MCYSIRGPVEWHCTRNGWIPYYCKSSIDDLLYSNKLSYLFVFEMPHLNVNKFSCQEFTVPLTWNFTSSNERVSSSSERDRSNYAKFSSTKEIFEKQLRFSLLSSIEWSHYSWVSSVCVYILENQEDFPRYSGTSYSCILHISFKSSISL